MNEYQRDKLEFIASDEILLSALHAHFTAVIEEGKPKIAGENNELLGQKYRGYEESKRIVAEAMSKLDGYRKSESKKEGTPSAI